MPMKPDVARLWAQLPSKDIDETQVAQRTAPPTPLVQIGTVAGDSITVTVMAGATFSMGEFHPKRQPDQPT